MRLYLHGPILEDNSTLNTFSKELDHVIESGASSIEIEISSGGGCLYSGIAIYNRLKSLQIPVTTIANAECMSAAVLVFAAGGMRIAYPNTTFMVHEVSNEVSGSTLKIKRQVDQQLREQLTYAKLLSKNSKLKDTDWIKLMNVETYFDEQEALRHGLCMRILK